MPIDRDFLAQLELVQVGMKAITAAISYATAISVYRLIPLALAIPSPVRLEEEVNERKKAQRRLQHQVHFSKRPDHHTNTLPVQAHLRARPSDEGDTKEPTVAGYLQRYGNPVRASVWRLLVLYLPPRISG